MGNTEAGWNEPSVPTKYLDAEDTGRTVDGISVVREVVAVTGGTLTSVSGGSIEISAGTVAISGTVSVTETSPVDVSSLATEATLGTIDGKIPDESGSWAYSAGSAGTATFTGRVIGIAAHATTAGSAQINGGDWIPVPANAQFDLTPKANLAGPGTVVFTGTDSYFVETVT